MEVGIPLKTNRGAGRFVHSNLVLPNPIGSSDNPGVDYARDGGCGAGSVVKAGPKNASRIGQSPEISDLYKKGVIKRATGGQCPRRQGEPRGHATAVYATELDAVTN